MKYIKSNAVKPLHTLSVSTVSILSFWADSSGQAVHAIQGQTASLEPVGTELSFHLDIFTDPDSRITGE